MFQKIKDVHTLLEQGEDISDEDILTALNTVSLMTNTLNAAHILLWMIAPVCGYRQHLESQLLHRMLMPLVMTGFDEAAQVVKWMQYHLENPDSNLQITLKGIEWLKLLMHREDFLQQVLDKAVLENDEFNLQDVKDYFMPHSKIAAEHIEFHYYWRNRFWQNIGTGIVFMQVTLNDDDEEKEKQLFLERLHRFEQLTEILAQSDKNRKLKLLVFSWDGYDDLLFHLNKPNTQQIFANVAIEKNEIYWLHNGEILFTTPPDNSALEQIPLNTKALMERQSGQVTDAST